VIFQYPPSDIARVLIEKATWDRGFNVELGLWRDTWFQFGSTTADAEIWIAAAGNSGPFALSVSDKAVAAQLGRLADFPGPGGSVVWFDDDDSLTRAVDCVWKLARGLPLPSPALLSPLAAFEAATAALPRTTEAERLVIQRIGQDKFRDALMLYWNGSCPLTGITDANLLRASHIIPWAECASDAERLDIANGLLLSSLWDAAFDAHLVTFEDDGAAIASPRLSLAAVTILAISSAPRLNGLNEGHRARLSWHRAKTLMQGPVV